MSSSPHPLSTALVIAVLAGALLSGAASAQAPDRRPMTIADVQRMVEQGVRPQTILTALRDNCLAVYGLNEPMRQKLADAGADNELLEGLSQVCWGTPGGPMMDPTRPFIMFTEPGEWSAEDAQPITVSVGQTLRVQGMAHAPSGIRRLEVNGQQASLSSDPEGGVRFSSAVAVAAGTRSVDLTLYPERGAPYHRTLPLRLGTGDGAAVPTALPYRPGWIAVSGLFIPGSGQFWTGQPALGALFLGAAVTGIALVASAGDGGVDPVTGEDEPESGAAIAGVLLYYGSAIGGAVLAYRHASAANERVLRGAGPAGDAGARLGRALLKRVPTPDRHGRWTVELARIHF